MLHSVPSGTIRHPARVPCVPRAAGGSRKPKYHVWTQFITPKAWRGSGILQRTGQEALFTQILIRISQSPIFSLYSPKS